MKRAEHTHQVYPDGVLETLIKLCWKTIRTWSFVVFHKENHIFYFLLGTGGHK
jgi:hypothetical protein